jgi:flagellum-specific peptidoglycan hydrolase FlgJ
MMPVKNALENTLNPGVVQRSCFISNGRSRYSSLFTLAKEDYQSWATGLRAGYATDPKYPEN